MPSSTSLLGEELAERDFFWKRARARIFFLESTGRMDNNRSTIKHRVADPNSRRTGSAERKRGRWVDAHRLRVMHGGFGI